MDSKAFVLTPDKCAPESSRILDGLQPLVQVYRPNDPYSPYAIPRLASFETTLSEIRKVVRWPKIKTDDILCKADGRIVISNETWPFVCATISFLEIITRERTDVEVISFKDEIDFLSSPADSGSAEPSPSHPNMTQDQSSPLSSPEHRRSISEVPSSFQATLSRLSQNAEAPSPASRCITPTTKPARKTGMPDFRMHLSVERKFLRAHKRAPWVLPPKAKSKAVRDVLNFRAPSTPLSQYEIVWVTQRRLKSGRKDTRALIGPGIELYEELLEAHGNKHYCATTIYMKLKERIVTPSINFIAFWCKYCPECRKPSA